MAINVNYEPNIQLMGQAAFGVGLGQFAARQDASNLNWAQLDQQAAAQQQQAQLAQQQILAHQQAQVFGRQADLQRMAFGAGLENQQRLLQYDKEGAMAVFQQEHALERQAAQQKFQEEQQKRAAEYDKQQALDRMSEPGKIKKAEMDRELAAIEGAGLMPEQKQHAMQQWGKRHEAFDPGIYALPDTRVPGKTVSIGGFDHLVQPDGSTAKMGPTKIPAKQWFEENSIGLTIGENGLPVDPATNKPIGFTWNTARGGYELVKTLGTGLKAETFASFYKIAAGMAETAAGPGGIPDFDAVHENAVRMARSFEAYNNDTPMPPPAPKPPPKPTARDVMDASGMGWLGDTFGIPSAPQPAPGQPPPETPAPPVDVRQVLAPQQGDLPEVLQMKQSVAQIEQRIRQIMGSAKSYAELTAAQQAELAQLRALRANSRELLLQPGG